ncbi:MAG: GNAT family N-acetyltransferase [Spirochaetes bacterium]|nr:GNAT family N-acetyltransferase [Spirochaetota bacterium]
MTIKEIYGMPNYAEIIDLISVEWPPEFGKKTDGEKIKQMQDHYNIKTDTVKYLLDAGKVIGFYRYTLWPRENPMSHAAHILDIAILPTYQNRGLGTRLMKDLIQDCRRKRINRLLSRSFKSNRGSIRLHQSLGFTQHMSTEDSIVWELDIEEKPEKSMRKEMC